MDFKLAVTGTVQDIDDPDLLEQLKDMMADDVRTALEGVPGVAPQAFYLQVGQGTEVNIRTVADGPQTTPENIRPATDTEVQEWLG